MLHIHSKLNYMYGMYLVRLLWTFYSSFQRHAISIAFLIHLLVHSPIPRFSDMRVSSSLHFVCTNAWKELSFVLICEITQIEYQFQERLSRFDLE